MRRAAALMFIAAMVLALNPVGATAQGDPSDGHLEVFLGEFFGPERLGDREVIAITDAGVVVVLDEGHAPIQDGMLVIDFTEARGPIDDTDDGADPGLDITSAWANRAHFSDAALEYFTPTLGGISALNGFFGPHDGSSPAFAAESVMFGVETDVPVTEEVDPPSVEIHLKFQLSLTFIRDGMAVYESDDVNGGNNGSLDSWSSATAGTDAYNFPNGNFEQQPTQFFGWARDSRLSMGGPWTELDGAGGFVLNIVDWPHWDEAALGDLQDFGLIAVYGWGDIDLNGDGVHDRFAVAETVAEEPAVEEPAETVTEEPAETVTDTPVAVTTDSSDGSFPIWIPIVVFGVAIGGFFVWFRSRGNIESAIAVGADYATPSSASTDLTEEDLESYSRYGIDDHAAAEQAEDLATEKAADMAKGDAAAAATAAAIAEAGTPDLEPLPVKPDLSNLVISDIAAFDGLLHFLHVVEMETISGRGRDRVAAVLVAIPDAWDAALDGKVQEIETAKEGWENIFNNPEALGQLDDGVVYAAEQAIEFAEDYGDAALRDDDEFVQMNATLVASAQLDAVLGGAGTKFKGAITRVKGGSAPDVPTKGAKPPAAGGPGGNAPPAPTRPVPPPATAPAAPPTPPTRPVPPTQAPSTHQPMGTSPAPDPLGGYRGSARTGTPVTGGGTPIQRATNGCGAAVVRGVANDMGLPVPTEISILARGAQLFDGQGNRIWNPNGGINGPGMGVLLDDIMPDGTSVAVRGLAGSADAAADVGSYLLDNPTGNAMVGLRWGGAGTGGAGHWVRVERVTNSWVHLGDPSLPAGTSIAIPTGAFNILADTSITVTP